MKMHDVNSSQIQSAGYDPQTQKLAIKFRSGGTYHYAEVPPGTLEELLKADSVGKHFHQNVKGKYQHTKIGE